MRTDKSYMIVISHFKLYPALFPLKWLICIPNISAVRGNLVFETLHDFYRTAIKYKPKYIQKGWYRQILLYKNAMHCNEEDKALHVPIQCFAWSNGKHCIKIPTKTNCRYTCHPHKSSRASHPTSESPPRRFGKRWKTWDTIKYEPTMYAFGYYLNVRVLTSHTRSPTIRNNSSATSAKHIYKLLWRKKLIVTP